MVELSTNECVERLQQHGVGRIAITEHALPLILPVKYRVTDTGIELRTEPGGLLARACRGAVIAFEIDELSPDGRSGWSVLVIGIADALEHPPFGQRDHTIVIRPGTITGRQTVHEARDSAA